jgi:hypothetical protein
LASGPSLSGYGNLTAICPNGQGVTDMSTLS